MENFYTSFKPFFDVAKLCGLFPYSFDGPTRKGIFKTKFNGYFFASITLCFLIMIIIKTFNIAMNQSNAQILEAKVWCWILNFGSIFSLIYFIFQNCHLKEILDIFHLLHFCDEKLLTLNTCVDFKKEKTFNYSASYSVILCPLVYFVTMLILSHFLGVVYAFQWYIMYSHFLMYKLFFFAQFIVTSNAVKERFAAMNSSMM